MHYVYRLRDPRTNAIRYIGITNNPDGRLLQHARGNDLTGPIKLQWLTDLRELSLKPIMEVIESTETRREAEKQEKYWIRTYLEQGHDLLNVRSGVVPAQPKPRKKPMSIETKRNYYTASEAQAILDMSKAEFHKRVKQGRIPTTQLPAMKQHVYPKNDIDTLGRAFKDADVRGAKRFPDF